MYVKASFIFTALLILLGGGYLYSMRLKSGIPLYFSGETAEGVVTQIELKPSCKQSYASCYQRIVIFTDYKGRSLVHHEKDNLAYRPNVGDEVTVAYDRDNPNNAIIKEFYGVLMRPTLLLVFSIALPAYIYKLLMRDNNKALTNKSQKI